VWDLSEGPLRILVETGTLDCTEEFYYSNSARQVEYEGEDVQRISFLIKSEIKVKFGLSAVAYIILY
jgi:ethanolamine utilization microcompartment shell protein EutL